MTGVICFEVKLVHNEKLNLWGFRMNILDLKTKKPVGEAYFSGGYKTKAIAQEASEKHVMFAGEAMNEFSQMSEEDLLHLRDLMSVVDKTRAQEEVVH